jgi:hypothetical protein
MTSRTPVLLAVLVGGSLFTAVGCASGGSPPSPPATVRQVCYPGEAPPTCYFDVVLDFTSSSHREVGRQYALAILQAKPDYEAAIDYLLAEHVFLVQVFPPNLTFAQVLARAQTLHANPSFPAEYKEEIAGMQEVFDYDVDKLGDGRLSRNEFLVFQFLSEVVRPTSCSVSAVTGSTSATGKTLFGRNWDWLSVTAWGTGSAHAMTTFRNGGKTIANFGSLGMLFALTVFNQHHLAGAIVNATTKAQYPEDLSSRRSFFFDLRYAFENFSTLAEIADYLKAEDHRYVYNHNMFLADPTTAGVVENQVNSLVGQGQGNRAFRTDASTLSSKLPPEQSWGILGTFVTVNDFRLPGNDWLPEATENTTRWESFRRLYVAVPFGQRFDVDALKAITGYPGPDGDGVMTNGAIFNSELQKLVVPPGGKLEPAETTMQSILMDMGTMELWVHLVPPVAPWTKPPLQPTYRKIANPIY